MNKIVFALCTTLCIASSLHADPLNNLAQFDADLRMLVEKQPQRTDLEMSLNRYNQAVTIAQKCDVFFTELSSFSKEASLTSRVLN